jgi:hypothetical protein
MEMKSISAGITVLLLAFAVPVGVHYFREKEEKPAQPPSRSQEVREREPEEPDPDAPRVTRAEFDRVRTGISYFQLLDIVGETESDTKQVYHEGVEGYTSPHMTIWYIWENPDGSTAEFAFISNKLVEKKQKKLPD